MSSPTSTKLTPPNYLDPRVRRKYIWIYLFQVWISLIPASFLVLWFFYSWFIRILPSFYNFNDVSWTLSNLVKKFWDYPNWAAGLILPILIAIIYITSVIWSAIITKLIIATLNRIHAPSEGVFFRNLADKDYLFWNLRNLSRIFLFWLISSSPFIFLKKTFLYTFFGVPIGKKSVINQTWISPEFVEIGENVIIGQSAALYSYLIQGDKLLVAKIQIADGVKIGPQTVLLPGTKVYENVIVDGGSFAHPFTVMDSNSIYGGIPCEKLENSEKIWLEFFK
ncbi:MAG: acyltransferase [Promethearchaeota archaeon]